LSSWFFLNLFALIFCLIQAKETKHHLELHGVLYFGALVSAAVGIYEFFILGADRATSLQGWPTAFAGHLILFTPLAIYSLRHSATWKRWVFLGLFVLGLFSAQSILPILALGLAYALVRRSRWEFLIGAVLLIALVLPTKSVDSFIKARTEYAVQTFKMIGDHPILGAGAGTYESKGLSKSAYAHNSYLQTWAETGPLGLVALLGLACAFIKMRPVKPSLSAWAMYIGLLAVFIDNCFSFTILKPSLAFVWWVVLAIYVKEWRTNETNSRH
jgi:O-antigen ligase